MIIEGPIVRLRRVRRARPLSLAELASSLERRASAFSGDAAAMLRAQAMMARDPVLHDRLAGLIAAGRPFEQALAEAAASFGVSHQDVGELVRDALYEPASTPHPGYAYVLVADSLSVADMMRVDPAEVLGVVTAEGGPTSHAAILARSMGIPYLSGYAVSPELDVIRLELPDPSPVGIAPQRVPLLANISSPADLALAQQTGAEGVGLLRTEFYTDYASVAAAFEGKPIVVRVLDSGARDLGGRDLGGRDLGGRDENPLGVRGIRYLRARPSLLDAQLASLSGMSVSVMAPMVSTVDEARWFRARCARFGITDVGVMIEVPAAALCADEILAEVDFASIGTNDLTQFTLAADRQIGALSSYQDASHPAVLRLVEFVADAGRRLGKPVSVCGEAAADPALASVLIGLGVTSMSVAPAAIPAMRRALWGLGALGEGA
ncbi:putative PEP-binding protein [Allorhizocola rhizosphaerae]|uniref:putative PEP-binding protein n=1 Tax=Allorhizocola rhizosphaerae TaxID=1872709 RepID=UPI000E3BD6BF|nr:putative PEP-binding protein [Allorhizocola rhizosphaerae]